MIKDTTVDDLLKRIQDLERRVAECELRLPVPMACIQEALTNVRQATNTGLEDFLTKLNGKPKDFL